MPPLIAVREGRLRILPQPLTLTLPDPRLLSQGRILHRTRHTALPLRGIHVTGPLMTLTTALPWLRQGRLLAATPPRRVGLRATRAA